MRKLTKEEWIKKAKEVHGDKYDYSKVEYVNSRTKVCIICPKHGEFWQEANAHLMGQGCQKCYGNYKMTTEEFIKRARKIHGDKYDYSKVEYTGDNKTKICIICPEHGEFWQVPNSHLSGNGCPVCRYIKAANNNRGTKERFIKKAKEIHGDKYDYSKVKYDKSNKVKVCIICPEHGEFWQTPINHINGAGCPICKESKLENELADVLEKNNIQFVRRCGSSTLDWLGRQHLDFYLPEYRVGIECQGIQHFKPVDIFGGESGFYDTITRDTEKIKKCINNNVKLLHYSKFPYKGFYKVFTSADKLLNEIKNEDN